MVSCTVSANIYNNESYFNLLYLIIYLIQLSGSPSQSVLHRNRSHDSHPIGGVRAKPFSKQFVLGIITLTNTNRVNTTANN